MEYTIEQKLMYGMVKKGQVIIGKDGNEYVYLKAMRKNVSFKERNGSLKYTAPFDWFKEIREEFEELEKASNSSWEELAQGDLFALVSYDKVKKDVFVFVGKAASRYIGISISSGKRTKIDPSFNVKKIDIEEIKRCI